MMFLFLFCQRPAFSLGVSQHMHKITNLWKFELNRSHKVVWSRGLKLEFKYFSEKLLLCHKVCYFKGSLFSQCFIPSTTLHCLLPTKFFC